MKRLEEHRKTQRAIELLAHDLRPCIVVLETGITKQKSREFYQQLHGVRPRPGQMRDSDSIVRTKKEYAAASYLMRLYVQLAPHYESRVNPEAVVAAHRIFKDADLPREYDIKLCEAWVLARALRSAEATLVPCSSCRAHYLEVARQHTAPACPFC